MQRRGGEVPRPSSHLASSTVFGLQVGGIKEREKRDVKPWCSCGWWLPPRPPSGDADADTLTGAMTRGAERRWGSV